jgi:hypothetical protein
MFFPNYTNIYPELREILDSRAENTNKPNSMGGVSGLSTWIRVISAAGNGLVMESIHKPDSYKITDDFTKSYGNTEKPGIIGYELDLKTPVEITTGTGRGLRPSPIITSMSVEEAQRGALKLISFNVRCFTKEQVDTVAKYLLEPGFRILVEWGWNVNDSYSQRVGSGGAIDVCDIVKYNNWNHIKDKRRNSKYQYDASLGIITGGGIKFAEGETFDLEIKSSGMGEISDYIQVQGGGSRTDVADDSTPASFEPEKIGESTQGTALFKQMFNLLPNQKKTPKIRKWASSTDSNNVNWAYEGNFVNFDEEIREYLLKTLTEGAVIRNKGGDKLEIPSNVPLFDSEKFIRFELAAEILNSYSLDLERKETECSETKTDRFYINIKNTVIKAFPHMFSTDKSKLYIANTQAPNFGLRQALVDSDNEEPIKFINFEELGNKEYQANLHPLVEAAPDGDERAEKNGSADDPATGQSRPVPYAFPCLYDLDDTVLKFDCDESVDPIQEKAGFWGWLKDLYINFDFFIECMLKPNMNARDVFFEMLNGMNSACNSIWDFQIKEGPEPNDPNGPTEVTIIDNTFTGYVPEESTSEDTVATYEARGVRSPFTSFTWDMNVPGAVQSSVMIKKMTNNKVDGSGDTQYIMYGNVYSDPNTFEDKVSSILANIKPSQDEPESLKDEEEQKPNNAQAYDLFANKAGVFSRVQDRKGKIDIVESITDPELSKKSNGTIESLLCVGTWNDKKALKSVELIDRGLKEGISGEVDKEYTNRVNPIPGLAKVRFSTLGISGFKVGDKLRFDGIPLKYGAPSFYQVIKTGHSLSGMVWQTDIECDFRLISSEE